MSSAVGEVIAMLTEAIERVHPAIPRVIVDVEWLRELRLKLVRESPEHRDNPPPGTFVLRNGEGKFLDKYGAATWAPAGARLFTEDEANIALGALRAQREVWSKCQKQHI